MRVVILYYEITSTPFSSTLNFHLACRSGFAFETGSAEIVSCILFLIPDYYTSFTLERQSIKIKVWMNWLYELCLDHNQNQPSKWHCFDSILIPLRQFTIRRKKTDLRGIKW